MCVLSRVSFDDAFDTLYEPNAVFSQFLGSFFSLFLSLLPLLVLPFLAFLVFSFSFFSSFVFFFAFFSFLSFPFLSLFICSLFFFSN